MTDHRLPPWWRHQMETFSALLALCAANSPVTGEFLAQRPVTRTFEVFFDLCRDRRLSKQSWGWWYGMISRPLWRHCNARRRLSVTLAIWTSRYDRRYQYISRLLKINSAHNELELRITHKLWEESTSSTHAPHWAQYHMAYRPDVYYWDCCYPGTLSLIQITATHLTIGHP